MLRLTFNDAFDAGFIEKARREHLASLKMDRDLEIERYGNEAGRLHPQGWRERITLDFSECQHGTRVVLEADAMTPSGKKLGTWQIEVCARCGEQVGKVCTHEINEWVFDGALLVCANCGIDAT